MASRDMYRCSVEIPNVQRKKQNGKKKISGGGDLRVHVVHRRGFGAVFGAFEHGNRTLDVGGGDAFGETVGPTVFDVCFACEAGENFHVPTSEFECALLRTNEGFGRGRVEIVRAPSTAAKHAVVDVSEVGSGGSR